MRHRFPVFIFAVIFAGQLDLPVFAAKDSRLVNILQASALTPSPGDTVLVRDGGYADVNLTFKASGTEGKPVVYMAETPGGVLISGLSRIRVTGSWLVFEGFRIDCGTIRKGSVFEFRPESSRCRISDCLFDGSKGETDIANSLNLLVVNGTANEVSRCSFTDKKTKGVMVAVRLSENARGGHVIRNNYFTRPTVLRSPSRDGRPGSAINGQECVQVGLSQMSMLDFKTVVKDNWFHHCDGEIETISGKSCGNIYCHNLLDECKGSITQRHGNDCVIRDNYIDGGHVRNSGGIRIIGERHIVENNRIMNLRGGGATRSAVSVIRGFQNPEPFEYFQAKDVIIRDNQIIDCDWGLLLNYSMRKECVMPPVGLVVKGNVIVCTDPSQVSVCLLDMPQEEVVFRDNAIIGGTRKGVSLPEKKSAAKSVRDERTRSARAAEMDAIRRGAGARWLK